MAKVSWDTSFAPPPQLVEQKTETPQTKQKHLNVEQVSILLDTTSCPRGTGQGDAKAQSVLHSKVKPPLKPRTPDNSRSPARHGPHHETCRPSLQNHSAQRGEDASRGSVHGDSLVKGSPLMKGPVSLAPELPRAPGAAHSFSFPGLCAGEEENTG